MLQVLTVLLIIVSLLLLLATYFQDSEGGLTDSASFGGGNNVRAVNRFLERLSIICFALVVLLSIGLNVLHIKNEKTSAIDKALATPQPPAIPLGK